MKEMALYNYVYYILSGKKANSRIFKGFVIHTGQNSNEKDGSDNLKMIIEKTIKQVSVDFDNYFNEIDNFE